MYALEMFIENFLIKKKDVLNVLLLLHLFCACFKITINYSVTKEMETFMIALVLVIVKG